MNTDDEAAIDYATDNGATWESFDYHIAGHFIAALCNGDDSGLEDAEIEQLERFERRAVDAAEEAGALAWHWSGGDDNGEDFRRCDVGGMLAMCDEVKLMILVKGDK